MKILSKILILCFVCIIFVINIPISLADSQINIIASKDTLHQDEVVQLTIELKDANVAAFTIEIYWDRTMLEYIKGPENSNDTENRILYTWVSENGENKQNIKVEGFEFKGIQDGIANVMVTGEFYNASGEQIEIADASLQIQIGEVTTKIDEEIVDNNQENVPDNSANLKILRLNEEGISPEFSKETKEYYLIVNELIDSLNITAIPENKNASVHITGNKNLKIGKNEIQIKVQSADKKEDSIYKIYVTRTSNVELANANLETLAIRQTELIPEFNNKVTKYRGEIANDIEEIDILAIPQRMNAEVKIQGNGKMNVGENIITVTVLAEDKITTKKYEIIVYRRNYEEEKKIQEEQKIEAEKLSAILEQVKTEEGSQNNIEKENMDITKTEQKKNLIIQIVIFLFIIAIIIGSIFWRYYKDKKEI